MYLTLLYLTCRYLIYCLYPSVYTGFSATRLNPSIFLPIAIYSIFPKHPNHYLRYLPYLIMPKFESYQVGTYRTECCTTRSRYVAQCLALCCQQYQYIPYISQSDAAFSFHTSHELANSEFLSILIDKLASSALPSFSACLHDDAYPHLLIVHRNAMLCN